MKKSTLFLASILMLVSLFNMEIYAEPVPEPVAEADPKDFVLVPLDRSYGDNSEYMDPMFRSAHPEPAWIWPGTTLLEASYYGQVEVVKELLRDPQINVNQANWKGATPLIMASYNGHVEVVKQLLARPQINVNQAGKGITPLIMASQHGHVEVVKKLLAHPQIKVNQDNGKGVTPLYMASYIGQVEVVKELLADPQINVNQADVNGATPLIMASANGHVEVVKKLLAHPQINVNQALTTDGRTPLFIASQEGHVGVVKALLADGRVDPNIRSNWPSTDWKNTAFTIAAFLPDRTEVVKELLKCSKVDITITSGVRGYSVLDYARKNGNAEIESAILSRQSLLEQGSTC